MKLSFSPNQIADYRKFLAVKKLPRYRIAGRMADVPDEYAHLLGVTPTALIKGEYAPQSFLFDYQRDISALAIRKRRFAVFADCGLGKTLILLEFARHCAEVLPHGQCALIVSPLMVVGQTLRECRSFYGDSLPVEQVRAADLPRWLADGTGRIGITNYEALTKDFRACRLGALILDESSMLKSHYGRWGRRCLELGAGLEWKLCLTGTPAPNDRIEYANHAVFLDQHPTVNSFLAKYFVNRGQTGERWELKPHALRPFYRDLSHWCVFVSDPGVYGWKDHAGGLPPIHVHIHPVPLTKQQRELAMTLTRGLFSEAGGFVQRGRLARLAKGIHPEGGRRVATRKPEFVRDLVASWPDESSLIWCNYNREQDGLAKLLPAAASIAGEMPLDERLQIIDEFKSGSRRTLISKPKVLGFGLNLQVATRQVFSSLMDSYESYYQAVKRSNRVGSTRPLNVHIPVTEIEEPMVANVLRKAARVQMDTEEQERLFREVGYVVA